MTLDTQKKDNHGVPQKGNMRIGFNLDGDMVLIDESGQETLVGGAPDTAVLPVLNVQNLNYQSMTQQYTDYDFDVLALAGKSGSLIGVQYKFRVEDAKSAMFQLQGRSNNSWVDIGLVMLVDINSMASGQMVIYTDEPMFRLSVTDVGDNGVTVTCKLDIFSISN